MRLLSRTVQILVNNIFSLNKLKMHPDDSHAKLRGKMNSTQDAAANN